MYWMPEFNTLYEFSRARVGASASVLLFSRIALFNGNVIVVCVV